MFQYISLLLSGDPEYAIFGKLALSREAPVFDVLHEESDRRRS
jgi:hypothetical protein